MPPPKDPKKYKEWVRKRREANMGEKNPFFGKQHTEESRQKMRESSIGLRVGEKNPMFGRRGEGSPHWGKKRTEETKQKIGSSNSKAQKGKHLGSENSNWKGGPYLVECSNCGQPLLRSRTTIENNRYFYCNAKCQGQWRGKNWTGISNPRFLPDKQRSYSQNFNEQLKELIRLRDGYKCQKCGCPEIENGQKLSVHHIDYDKSNSLPSNLIALCRRCNGLVNFVRKKWTRYFKRVMDKGSKGMVQLHFRG